MGELTKDSGSQSKADSGANFRARNARKWSAVAAVEFFGGSVKIAKASGGAITQCAAVPLESDGLEPADSRAMGEAIAEALASAGLKLGPVVMGVPRDQVILKTVDVPPLNDERELASLVHYQIARDLPFPMGEAVIDFRVTRRKTIAAPDAEDAEDADADAAQAADSKDVLEVLVAAVKRDSVARFRETAEAAKLNLVALGWTGYANFRCLQACGHTSDSHAVALVSVKTGSVNVDVVAHESVVFSRGDVVRPAVELSADVAGGESREMRRDPEVEFAEGIDDPEAFAKAAAVNVVRSLHGYGGVEQGAPVGRIVIGGVTGCEWAVIDLVEEQTGIPCVYLDPAEALGLPREQRLAAAGSISAIGLACGAASPTGLAFNFLNPKKPAVHRDLGRVKAMLGIVAAMAVLIGLLGLRASMLKKREEINRQLVEQLAAEKSRQKIYRAGRLQAKTIADWLQGGDDWLKRYAHLSSILPGCEEIYLTSFSVSRSGTIRFGVQAKSGAVIAKLDANLRTAGYDVRPIAITPGSDRHGYPFRSTVEITPTSGVEIDLAKLTPPARPEDDASLDALKGGGG